MKKENLVSIITPLYNCEKYISQTINSVLNQTYKDFELIIVDDGSIDKSCNIVKEYEKKDKRIRFFRLEGNSGAAYVRNYALKQAKGRYIAYLDSDDLWDEKKLEIQINFMKENNYAFTCTDYMRVSEDGRHLKAIKMPKKIDYNLYLRNTIIQTVGVVIDRSIVNDKLLIMPNIKRRQDAATWCQILKHDFSCYRVPFILSYYRVVNDSLSSNKLKAARDTWNLYRNIEMLSFIKSCYCFSGYAYNAVRKRIHKR